ncbi:MAG: PAS domain S-box protein, partial [Acidimicrobiia bacterium]|nr:PAS domain S-box protein [Acidimicrobiia bacterium]
TEITGWKPHEVIGRNPRILKSGRHDEAFYAEMWRALAEEGRWRGEVTNRAKNGTEYRERLTITTIHDPDGLPEGYVAVFTETAT